jgi:hypothetical protein
LDSRTRHDQSSVHIGPTGTVHVIGADISAEASIHLRASLLYGRSTDGGQTCKAPQVVETSTGVVLVGPDGYYVLADRAAALPERQARRFGEKLVRTGISPDHKRIYVIGDSTTGGLLFHWSTDGARTWRRAVIEGLPAGGC